MYLTVYILMSSSMLLLYKVVMRAMDKDVRTCSDVASCFLVPMWLLTVTVYHCQGGVMQSR